MKYSYLFIIIVFLVCSCSDQVNIDAGKYYTMSVSMTDKAIEDGIDFANVPRPIFEFKDNNILKISSDGLSLFGDTIFKYKLKTEYLILKSGNGKKSFEYKLNNTSDRIKLNLYVNSDYIKTIDLVCKHESKN